MLPGYPAGVAATSPPYPTGLIAGVNALPGGDGFDPDQDSLSG